jgi:hypothetical protein
MPDEVRAYLEEIADLPCTPLLRMLVEQLCGLDAGLEPEVVGFGIRFRNAGEPLCELSVFGELFIARVGREHAVEYRVRSQAVAFAALDRILHELHSVAGPSLAE